MREPIIRTILITILSWSFSVFSLPSGLIAYFPFDHGIQDSTGNWSNGTLFGPQAWVAGHRDSALYFNGSTNYISYHDVPSLAIGNQLTICAWIRPEVANMWYKIAGKANSGQSDDVWSLGLAMNGGVYFGFWIGGAQYYTNCSQQVALSQWSHFAGTWDGTTIRAYCNGVLQPETVQASGTVQSSTGPLIIGELANGTYKFHGAIDELMIFNRALSTSEIDSIYAGNYSFTPIVPVLIPYTPNPTYNRMPTVSWHPKPSISTYRVQLGSDMAFSVPYVSVPTTDTFFTMNANLPTGVVYWRVGNDADLAAWSGVSSITIEDSTVPILIHYAPDPTRNRRPTFKWHHVTNAASYQIQVSTLRSFSNLYLSNAATDTSYAMGADLPAGKIYWRVGSNLGSAFSFPDSVTILNDSIPWLISMSPEIQQTRRPVFAWHPATGANSYYRLEVDTTEALVNPLISLPIADTTYTPDADLPLGIIYWRVGAGTGTGFFSPVDSFWVKITSPTNRTVGALTPQKGSPVFSQIHGGFSLTYAASEPGRISFEVYSLRGSRVAALQRSTSGPGSITIMWKGIDNAGRRLHAGGYLVVCKFNNLTYARQMMLVQ
jgi:Concanavalin A-like lectin/glucanases superfamily